MEENKDRKKQKSVRFFFAGAGIALVVITCSFIIWKLVYIPKHGVTGTRSVDFQYFADRFVFSGTDTKGRPFLADVSLNRKENRQGKFLHYYFIDIFAN